MYEDLPTRIQNIYETCTEREQEILLKILQELSDYGESPTYEDIWLADYIEIPVDIQTFISDDQFLGRTNRHGEAVYPYWKQVLNEIFDAGNKYQEIMLTGATRIGKTSTAITGVAYMLYRLMCLRDPQGFFNKKEISKFSILFFNLTKELAAGVAFREFNDTLKESPWFNAHGTFSASERNFFYIPDGDKVVIDYGSDAAHGLGKQVFCLTGDTEILTDSGYRKLCDVADRRVSVAQYDLDRKTVIYTEAEVKLTNWVSDTVQVTLADGTMISGTPEHRILLESGDWCCLKDIQTFDRVASAGPIYVRAIHVSHVTVSPKIPVYDVLNVQPFHNFLIRGVGADYIAHNCAVMDEINFSRAGIKDVQKAKRNMMDLYNTVAARVKGTFRQGGEVYGKIFAVSSKRSDSDFMEQYIQDQTSAGALDHMYVSDKPQWEVLPPSMFHSERFYIAVGDRHKRGFVVTNTNPSQETLQELVEQGYKLMQPPIDMLPEFKADFDIALRDLAGISVPGALSFITQDTLTNCINLTLKNPFYNEIIELGTRSNFTIESLFHIEAIKHLLRYPTYIHLDLSLSDDRSGASGVAITGRKDIRGEDGRVVSMPSFTHVFSVAIQALRGDKIPYAKITEFILWLRRQGMNIARVSRDQFQSEYLGQLLEAQGLTVDKISLDRTPDGYIAGRSILMENRVEIIDCQLLQDEVIHLQRDSITGKVDHPLGGCFTSDTEIRLCDGNVRTFAELLKEYQEGVINYVTTYNEVTHSVEAKPIKSVFISQLAWDMAEVELSNGRIINCTDDHRFMLGDGTYKPIKDIPAGSVLMSYGRQVCVSKVTTYHSPRFVYDMEVVENHNFLLHAGVFVHNSKDVSDSFFGAMWNAQMHNTGVPVPISKKAKIITAANRPSANGARGADLPAMFPGLYTTRKPR